MTLGFFLNNFDTLKFIVKFIYLETLLLISEVEVTPAGVTVT